MLKLFFDTMPPGFAVARYAVPVSAFLVHFLAFLLCALVLVQERTAGTLERMFINGFGRAEIIGGYVLGYLGLATLQAVAALTEVLLLFQLSYSVRTLLSSSWSSGRWRWPRSCSAFSSRPSRGASRRSSLSSRSSSCRRSFSPGSWSASIGCRSGRRGSATACRSSTPTSSSRR